KALFPGPLRTSKSGFFGDGNLSFCFSGFLAKGSSFNSFLGTTIGFGEAIAPDWIFGSFFFSFGGLFLEIEGFFNFGCALSFVDFSTGFLVSGTGSIGFRVRFFFEGLFFKTGFFMGSG
ncbi:MAG TPA: hypothetical protein DIT94_00235, partial [Deltaproteobacteria bacterium]|nr:hypothetical protein [Deltaproteobacteria bacterium]